MVLLRYWRTKNAFQIAVEIRFEEKLLDRVRAIAAKIIL